MSDLVRRQRVLVGINGNVPEWRACLGPGDQSPRLPLPFAFGRGLIEQGLELIAYDASSKPPPQDLSPFVLHFAEDSIKDGTAAADIAVLWGTQAIRSCLAEVAVPRSKRKTIMFCYGWRPIGGAQLKRLGMLLLTRRVAQFSRGVVLMTGQQVAEARRDLPESVPIVKLTVGIDTAYYARPSTETDVPDEHKGTIAALLKEPYIILPGDELRLNNDALDVVQETGIRLVRISQYGFKSGTNLLKEEVSRRGLSDRVFVFESISYAFLRFLIQHAAAYTGFVDSSWQPAGWTVACESLACGLPLVIYDGYTARELKHLGCRRELMRIVAPGDRTTFARELASLAKSGRALEQTSAAREFAARNLDVERTALEFGRNFAAAAGIGQ